MVIHESGGVLDAIKHLDMYKENIFDKLTVLEIYGKFICMMFLDYLFYYSWWTLEDFFVTYVMYVT